MRRRSVLKGGLSSLVIGSTAFAGPGEEVTIVISLNAHPRVRLGAERLMADLTRLGFRAVISSTDTRSRGTLILVGNLGTDAHIQRVAPPQSRAMGEESFRITANQRQIVIAGGGNSGALYGCQELAKLVERTGKLPRSMEIADEPKLRFRGTCLLWTKWGGRGEDRPLAVGPLESREGSGARVRSNARFEHSPLGRILRSRMKATMSSRRRSPVGRCELLRIAGEASRQDNEAQIFFANT